MAGQPPPPSQPACTEFPDIEPTERAAIWEAAQRTAAAFKPPTPAQRDALRLVWCTPAIAARAS